MRLDKGKFFRKLDAMGCRPLVVASHPRSGTHLCIDTLRLNFPQCRSWKMPFERADRLYMNIDAHALEGTARLSLIERIFKRVERPLVKTHALAGLSEVPGFWGAEALPFDSEIRAWINANAQFVYVYRDGREVMRSFHELVTEGSETPSFAEFIRQRVGGMSRVRLWARHVEGWLEDHNACCISMECLLSQTKAAVSTIAREVGLPWEEVEPALPPRCDKELLSRIMRRAASMPFSTAICAMKPSISKRHWSDVFTAADREFFHQEAGELLIRLGYEKSDAWVGPSSMPFGQPAFRHEGRGTRAAMTAVARFSN